MGILGQAGKGKRFDGVEILSRADYKQKEFANQFIYTPFAPVTIGDYVRQKVKRIIGKENVKKYDYDSVWRRILKVSKKSGKTLHLADSSILMILQEGEITVM